VVSQLNTIHSNFLNFSNFFVNYHLEGDEICPSPFVDNQTNTTWTLPLPTFFCPPIPGLGPSYSSRYMPGKHSSLFSFTSDSSGMLSGAPQHEYYHLPPVEKL